MFDSSDTLWEVAAAEVHRRETDRDEYGGVEVAGERTVFVMGSKAGVRSSSSDTTLPYFRFYGCALVAIFFSTLQSAQSSGITFVFFQGKTSVLLRCLDR